MIPYFGYNLWWYGSKFSSFCRRYCKKKKTVINFRNYKSIDVIDFSNHLLANYGQIRVPNCAHLINMSSMCVDCKTKIYRNVAPSYINQKAPIISKEITVKETGVNWYSSEIREAKKVLGKAENCIISTVTNFIKPNFV